MSRNGTDAELLEGLQREAYDFFRLEANVEKGLIADSTKPTSPCSIAGVGMALTTFVIAVEHKWLSREEAVERTLNTLRFFAQSLQGSEENATGYQGFFYHFLDKNTGERTWRSELSSIDTALMCAGALVAAQYFQHDTADEHEIRTLADEMYRRMEWDWILNGGPTISHGWRPEHGFLPYRWEGYDEALILYILALGSPTHPIPEECYAAWASTYEWRTAYGISYLHAGPLFTHQMSHCWIDFRDIQDAYMREKQINYFENSRRAAYIHQAYAVNNPCHFKGYCDVCWGLTASDGPGPASKEIEGREIEFFDYVGRGVLDGPDDGTIAPWAAVACLPFAPEIVIPAIRHYDALNLGRTTDYGFESTFNPTFSPEAGELGWVSPHNFAINQGPVVLMTENYRTGLVWRLMRQCPYIVRGLRRAGFRGGWLDGE
jgi:hypothetical protein